MKVDVRMSLRSASFIWDTAQPVVCCYLLAQKIRMLCEGSGREEEEEKPWNKVRVNQDQDKVT